MDGIQRHGHRGQHANGAGTQCAAAGSLVFALLLAGCSGSEVEADAAALPVAQASIAPPLPPELTPEVRKARLDDIREKRIEAARLEQEARLEADRARAALREAGGRCIGGVLYRKAGNAWVEDGSC